MSIINKMHQELQESAINSPVLSALPEKKTKQKILLFCLILFLLASSIALSYLIYKQRNEAEGITRQVPDSFVMDSAIATEVATANLSIASVTAIIQPNVAVVNKQVIASKTLVVNKEAMTGKGSSVHKEGIISKQALAEEVLLSVVPVAKDAPPIATQLLTTEKIAKKNVLSEKLNMIETKNKAHLEITKSILSDAELAKIHLGKAEQALQQGNNFLASKEKYLALSLKPDLHAVRKKLALYYYSIGEKKQAIDILKRGAVKFPQYSDFQLMLSRIALKNDDPQKAYLYLNQQPPKVEGHLDYHASYAILAQKFNKYEQAEHLYKGILKHRPNNGRWLMSLAIVQDKQGKQSLAIKNYQKALLQIDLSSKAKQYINRRLTYLATQQGTL